MDNKDFFFCYDRGLATHLRNESIPFITVAMNPSSKKVFTLFFRNEKLYEEINSYKGTKKAL
jgi:hypothetical protein